MRSILAALCIVHVCATGATAGLSLRRSSNAGSNSSISLRKRVHVNTLITEPGTAEVDWSSLYSFASGDFAMPSAFKYTPRGSNVLWGRTEYSIAFDTLSTASPAVGHLLQFSQAVSLNATVVVHDGDHFDFAIAPQASFFLRDESGARLGATAIARYDSGRNSTGVTLTWSGATHSSDSNPAGLLDAGFGYGRNLQGSPLLEKFTPHTNVLWEKATGQGSTVAVFEGIEFQLTERLAFDVSGQHFSVNRGPADNQIVMGITMNLGHTH
ncbi:MAG TPA: hypothetical protein VNH18_19595 [Bryobacteraceae bacterium]|nr:hypothetical protein [Bryobacteraceae bacterium]